MFCIDMISYLWIGYVIGIMHIYLTDNKIYLIFDKIFDLFWSLLKSLWLVNCEEAFVTANLCPG